MQQQEDEYQQLLVDRQPYNASKYEAKDQETANNDEEFKLFLQTEDALCAEGYQKIKEMQKKRMPMAFAPILRPLQITDRENNVVYHSVVAKSQADDVIKACRKVGVTAKTFCYNRQAWEEDKRTLTQLKESFENKRTHLNQVATDLFQDGMVALMHLKVIRAFIEGALRFGL